MEMATRSGFVARNHRLPGAHFAALCAGLGDRDAVRELWRGQQSRRSLLLLAVLDAVEAEPGLLGPLPPAAAAWEQLAAADRTAREEVMATLLHPQVGTWASYALRRHRGGARGDNPLWMDFAVLHAVALIASARAGLAWRTVLPVRGGAVMLPGLGLARFPDAPPLAVAEVVTEEGRIVLRCRGHEVAVPPEPARDSPGWWGLRRLSVGTDPRLAVILDDLDPFRDLADPVPPARLDGAAFATWRARLGDAWRLLCRNHPETSAALAEGVVSVVPIEDGGGWESRSASTGEAFGSVLISTPQDPVTLAVALVHEFQHIKLGGLMHFGELTKDDGSNRHYAPWRDDPRPLAGLVQGVYAFVGIAAFWRAHRATVTGGEAAIAEFEYAYTRAQVREGIRETVGSGGLTGWGERLLEGLCRRAGAWLTEPLPAEATRLAELLTGGHRAGWRIRHLRPAEDDVKRLEYAYRAGRSAPPARSPSRLEPYPRQRWSQGLLALVRRSLAGAQVPLTERLRSLGVDEADAALAHGDLAGARAGYQARIVSDPQDVNAWTGLGLSVDGPAREALRDHPELVLAVYRASLASRAAPDPARLADWLGRAAS
jgi:HEXXH motif-containing protein